MVDNTLPEYPMLAGHILARIVEPADVFLFREGQTVLRRSRSLAEVIPWLNGRNSLGELFEQLDGKVSPPEIVYLLNDLRANGMLCEGARAVEQAAEADLWNALGIDRAPKMLPSARQTASITAIGGRVGVEPLVKALQEIGIQTTSREAANLNVYLIDHCFREELTEINAAALASGRPWMLVKPIGQPQWVGPLFVPGITGCLVCLRDRVRLNRQIEDFLARTTNDSRIYETPVALSPVVARFAAGRAAQEIALWLAGRKERLPGRLYSVGWSRSGPEVGWHTLVRQPQCPVCGDPKSFGSGLPVDLQHQSASRSFDGGQRVESPEATMQRLRHHISPITGVVTWLVDLNKDSDGLAHSCAAGHNFAMGTDCLYWQRQSLRPRTGGKGRSLAQARISAVGEAIERYCGVYRGTEAFVRARFQDLGDRAIHPSTCLNFSQRQYEQRDVLNRQESTGYLHLIPRRFPEHLEIDWTQLRSLVSGEVRYLPTAFCYFGHPDVKQHFYCTGNTNGCAAGTVLEEAILQAFLELVERDSAAIWWYNRLARPAIRLESFQNDYISQLQEYYQQRGRDLWVLDLTSDLRIPVFAAVSRRNGGATEDLLIGLGAHLDPMMAMIRSLTELNQFLPAVSEFDAKGNTVYRWPDDLATYFWKNETLQTQPQLRPAADRLHKEMADFPNLLQSDVYDSLEICLDIARQAALDVLVLDQSRPDIDLKVVRVVVPGLRHFWRRLGPGRLYDVPVRLGWLDAPTSEDDVNPASIFF